MYDAILCGSALSYAADTRVRANLNMEILLGSANGADILWGILIEIPGDANGCRDGYGMQI